MGYGNIIMLALSPLFGKISGKSWIPISDILRSIEDGIAKKSGTPFFHVGVAIGNVGYKDMDSQRDCTPSEMVVTAIN